MAYAATAGGSLPSMTAAPGVLALQRAMLELKGDRFALMKAEYEKAGPEPSNIRYGYVVPNGPVDHGVFA